MHCKHVVKICSTSTPKQSTGLVACKQDITVATRCPGDPAWFPFSSSSLCCAPAKVNFTGGWLLWRGQTGLPLLSWLSTLGTKWAPAAERDICNAFSRTQNKRERMRSCPGSHDRAWAFALRLAGRAAVPEQEGNNLFSPDLSATFSTKMVIYSNWLEN